MSVPTLDSSVGTATSNTYASLDEYKAYIAIRRPQPAWTTLALGGTIDDQLTGDLIAACKMLDAGFSWTGQAATEEQVLVSPRVGWYTRNGYLIASDINPNELKDAQCELAVTLHDTDIVTDDDAAKAGVKSVKAGSVAVEFQAKSDSLESINTALRRQGVEFNYLTMPAKVRMLLVPQWYTEADLVVGRRDFIFEVL